MPDTNLRAKTNNKKMKSVLYNTLSTEDEREERTLEDIKKERMAQAMAQREKMRKVATSGKSNDPWGGFNVLDATGGIPEKQPGKIAGAMKTLGSVKNTYMGSLSGGISSAGSALEVAGESGQSDELKGAFKEGLENQLKVDRGRVERGKLSQEEFQVIESEAQENWLNAQNKAGERTEAGGEAVEGFYDGGAQDYMQNTIPEDERGFMSTGAHIAAEALGSTVPGLAASGATLAATKNPKLAYAASTAVMGAIEKGSSAEEYKSILAERKGISVEELSDEDIEMINKASTTYGVAAGALESVIPMKTLKKFTSTPAGKKSIVGMMDAIAKEMLLTGAGEGATEGLQNATQNLMAKLYEIDPDIEISEGVIESTIKGAIGGALTFGLAGGIADAANTTVDRDGGGQKDEPTVSEAEQKARDSFAQGDVKEAKRNMKDMSFADLQDLENDIDAMNDLDQEIVVSVQEEVDARTKKVDEVVDYLAKNDTVQVQEGVSDRVRKDAYAQIMSSADLSPQIESVALKLIETRKENALIEGEKEALQLEAGKGGINALMIEEDAQSLEGEIDPVFGDESLDVSKFSPEQQQKIEEMVAKIENNEVETADDREISPQVVDYSEAEAQVFTEMEQAEAGSRQMTENYENNDLNFEAVKSTFPSWVSDHLRKRPLFNKVMEMYRNGETPKEGSVLQIELLAEIKKEIISRAEVASLKPREEIQENVTDAPVGSVEQSDVAAKDTYSAADVDFGLPSDEVRKGDNKAKNEVLESNIKQGNEVKKQTAQSVETLPANVDIATESKVVGPKRIAPDRISQQQMTPEAGIQAVKQEFDDVLAFIEKAEKREGGARFIQGSKGFFNSMERIEKALNSGEDVSASSQQYYDKNLPDMKNVEMTNMIVENSGKKKMDFAFEGSTRKRKTQFGTHKDAFVAKVKEEGFAEKVYKQRVKKDISKGYKYPEEVVAYDKSFSTAVNSRERYEKGLATSFGVDDARIITDPDGRTNIGMKRQDGEPLTKKQVDEIADGVVEFSKALNLDMERLGADKRWVLVHLNGKNPFLMNGVAGLYRKTDDGISVSVGGTESFKGKKDGKMVVEKVNTIMAHELGHMLDYEVDTMLFDNYRLKEFARSMNNYSDMINTSARRKYYASKVEVTARMIEQYVAISRGQTAYFTRSAYWSKEVFEKQIKPMVEAGIANRFSEYSTLPKEQMQRKADEFNTVITNEQAREQFKRFGFAKGVTLESAREVAGGKAFGSYFDAIVKFQDNPRATTVPHEMFHAFHDLVATEQERNDAYDLISKEMPEEVAAYKKKHGVSDNVAREEVLAEEFAKHFVKNIEPKSKLEQHLTWLVTKLREVFTPFKVSEVDALFNRVLSPANALKIKKDIKSVLGTEVYENKSDELTLEDSIEILKSKYPDGVKMYHQTSEDVAEKILKDGFKGDMNEEVYFTAVEFDKNRATGGGNSAVLEMTLLPDHYEFISPDVGSGLYDGDGDDARLNAMLLDGIEGQDVTMHDYEANKMPIRRYSKEDIAASIQYQKKDVETITKAQKIASYGKELAGLRESLKDARKKGDSKKVASLRKKIKALEPTKKSMDTRILIKAHEIIAAKEAARREQKKTQEKQEQKERVLSRLDELRDKMKEAVSDAKEKKDEKIEDMRIERDEIKEVKKIVTDYADERLSDFPEQKKRLLATVRNATNAKDIEVARTFIDRLQSEAQVRHLKGKIKKNLKKTQVKTQGGKPVGKFTPEIQNVLDKMRDLSRMTNEAMEDLVIKNIDSADQGVISDDKVFENKFITAILSKDPEKLSSLLTGIEGLIHDGRSTNKFFKEIFDQGAMARNEEIVNVITGGDGIVDDSTAEKRLDWKQRARRGAISSFKTFTGWDNLLDILSFYDKGSDPKKSFLNQEFDMLAAKNEQKKSTAEALRKVQDIFTEVYGLDQKEAMQKHAEDAIELDLGTFENAYGKKFEIKMSRAELRKRYMEMQDPSLQETFFVSMGYTDEMVDAIKGVLSTQDKIFVQKQLDFYRDYHGRVNEVYKDMYGVELPFNEFYSPIARRDVESDQLATITAFLDEQSMRQSIAKGSLKSRVGSKKPLRDASDMGVLMQHVAEMEHFIAFADTSKKLNSTFSNADVRKAIKQNFGDGILKSLDHQISGIIQGGVSSKQNIAKLDMVRINFSRAVLAVKPAIAIKQLTSFPAYAESIPTVDFIKNYADFWKDPVNNYKTLKESSVLLQERGSNMERDIKDAMNSDEFAKWSGSQTFLNKLMLNIKIGDEGAIVMGGWSVYKYHLDQGKTQEEAIYEFEKATEQTQQSGDITEQSFWQSSNSVSKLLTSFLSSPNQYFRKEVDAVRNIIAKRGDPKQHAKTIFIYHILLPNIFQFVANGFDWEKEGQMRASLLGSMNGIFLVGTGLDSIIRTAMGQKDFGNEMAVYGAVDDITDMVRLVNDKDITEADIWKALGGAGGTIGNVTGLPAETLVDQTESIVKTVREGDPEYLWQMMGWSSYIAKRKVQDD